MVCGILLLKVKLMVSAREPLSVTPWYDSCFTFLFFLTFYGACVTLFLVGIMSDSTDYPTIFIAVLTTLFLWYFVASKRLASAVLWRIRCAYCFFLIFSFGLNIILLETVSLLALGVLIAARFSYRSDKVSFFIFVLPQVIDIDRLRFVWQSDIKVRQL